MPKIHSHISGHHRSRMAIVLLLAFLLALCHRASSNAASWAPQHRHSWRRMLHQDSWEEDGPAYNGSAVLSTYQVLNSSGAPLRSLLPEVSGYVQKAGPAEMLHWSQRPHYAVAREAIFLDWRQQELANPAPQLYAGQPVTCAAARHPPAPFHHCHVFVNHQYRVAYIRSPKSASTSIMNWLGQCKYNRTRNWNSTTCMSYTWEKYETPDQIAKIWKDYFFFGFIRNPWARAYSLYKDMTGTNHFLHKHGPRCQMQWGQFCKDPFAEFDRLYGSGCSHKAPHYAYWHMMDQYHCMITPTGEWAVDFLGRVEKGNQDWKVIVDEMNRRRLPGVPELKFSALEHVHKVEPGQKPGNNSQQLQPVQQQEQQQQPEQQQEQQQLRRLQEGEAAAAGAAGEGLPSGLPVHRRTLRLFGHLWRRVRTAAAAYTSAAGTADQDTDAAAAQANDAAANSSDGPYEGSNEHCIDAVSQWFACDIDKFGYLPPLTSSNQAAEQPVLPDGEQQPPAS